MKILILTSCFGNGHLSVAQALEEEYASYGQSVIVRDVLNIVYPKFHNIIYLFFNRFICRKSYLYNFLNQFGRKNRKKSQSSKRLLKELDKIQPDMIVTTWSGCGNFIGRLNIPVCICITDVGFHPGWLYPYATQYLVATNDVSKRLEEYGISKDKILVRGIPVKKEFYDLVPQRKFMNKKKILIMGGGLGIIPWLDDFLFEIKDVSNLEITIVTGRNQSLFKKIKNEYPSVHV